MAYSLGQMQEGYLFPCGDGRSALNYLINELKEAHMMLSFRIASGLKELTVFTFILSLIACPGLSTIWHLTTPNSHGVTYFIHELLDIYSPHIDCLLPSGDASFS
ncbi:hypothetical protein KP509_20G065300 [Ceratopteris richardii]|uniref:Uncharacterized protein n=1 Tax=Ceratopteris richardii TaxID=49495 RepID=A0A8T2SJB8_CERRI|nr:hypothetical protein KP509_20G065300 [Ceratopteris richardii]